MGINKKRNVLLRLVGLLVCVGLLFASSSVVLGSSHLVLYGVNSADDGLSSMNPADPTYVTFIGFLDPDSEKITTPVAMAIRPSDEEIFVWNNSPIAALLTVDRTTGLATQIGSGGGVLQALAFRS